MPLVSFESGDISLNFVRKNLSAALLLIAAVIWGSGFVAQKYVLGLSAFAVVCTRNFIGAAFLALLLPIFDKFRKNGRKLGIIGSTKKELFGGIACGVCLSIAALLQQIGIAETDAGKTSFITALYVLIVPIIGLLVGRRSPLHVWISVGIALLGFYLLCIKGDFSLAPSDLVVLLSAVVFAVHIMVIDKFSADTDGVRLSCIQFLTAGVINLPLTLIFGGIDPGVLLECALPLLYLGIGSSGIAYTLQIVGQKNTNPTVASVVLSLESIFGVIFSALLLGERMSLREYVGCAVVFIAVILAQIDPKELFLKKRKEE